MEFTATLREFTATPSRKFVFTPNREITATYTRVPTAIPVPTTVTTKEFAATPTRKSQLHLLGNLLLAYPLPIQLGYQLLFLLKNS